MQTSAYHKLCQDAEWPYRYVRDTHTVGACVRVYDSVYVLRVCVTFWRQVTMLFPAAGFSIIVTAYNMIGNPVTCACSQCGSSSIPLDVLNTHCWVTATYTIRSNLEDFGFQSGTFNFEVTGEGETSQRSKDAAVFSMLHNLTAGDCTPRSCLPCRSSCLRMS